MVYFSSDFIIIQCLWCILRLASSVKLVVKFEYLCQLCRHNDSVFLSFVIYFMDKNNLNIYNASLSIGKYYIIKSYNGKHNILQYDPSKTKLIELIFFFRASFAQPITQSRLPRRRNMRIITYSRYNISLLLLKCFMESGEMRKNRIMETNVRNNEKLHISWLTRWVGLEINKIVYTPNDNNIISLHFDIVKKLELWIKESYHSLFHFSLVVSWIPYNFPIWCLLSLKFIFITYVL